MNKIPDITKPIYKEEVLSVLENKYSKLGPLWASVQLEWLNGCYRVFNNHDKYLIFIYIKKKTLDFYSRNFIRLTFDEFYKKDILEIEKLNFSEIAKDLNIPKESARRKIAELAKKGVIKKKNKRIVLDRLIFPISKPASTIKRISHFLTVLAEVLKEEKILSQSFKSESIETAIKNNFSNIWKFYYDFQIPTLLRWKNTFTDLEAFHIWSICSVNDLVNNNKTILMNREDFIDDMFNSDIKENTGINAMSVSNISGIPRATVMRKLHKLVKNNFLKIDDKKHYKLTALHVKKIIHIHKNTIDNLSSLSTKIFNLLNI